MWRHVYFYFACSSIKVASFLSCLLRHTGRCFQGSDVTCEALSVPSQQRLLLAWRQFCITITKGEGSLSPASSLDIAWRRGQEGTWALTNNPWGPPQRAKGAFTNTPLKSDSQTQPSVSLVQCNLQNHCFRNCRYNSQLLCWLCKDYVFCWDHSQNSKGWNVSSRCLAWRPERYKSRNEGSWKTYSPRLI